MFRLDMFVSFFAEVSGLWELQVIKPVLFHILG